MGAAIAVIIRKEKDLVAHFRRAGALDSERAKTVDELGVEPRSAWDRLLSRAVIREAAPGTYYLDEPSWEALRRLRRRVAFVMLILVVVLGIIAVGSTVARL